jgi:hypothetical protein
MFFSLSNVEGPGSIWQHGSNGYVLVRRFDANVPRLAAVISRGAPASCAGARASRVAADLDASAERLYTLVPASAAVDLRRASNVEVTADRWQWDQLAVGEFADLLTTLQQENDPYYRDLMQDSLVIGRAVRLEGVSADLAFDRAVAANLRAKYPTGVGADLGGKATWADSTTLRLRSTAPIYVAVQMYRWGPQGLAAGQLKPDSQAANLRIVLPQQPLLQQASPDDNRHTPPE